MLAGDGPGRLECQGVGMLWDAIDMLHSGEREVQPHGTGTWMEGQTMGTILGTLEVAKNTRPKDTILNEVSITRMAIPLQTAVCLFDA